MELGAAGLQEQPFRTHGRPLITMPYEAQRVVLDFLDDLYAHRHGLGLLQSPSLGGKTTTLQYFADMLGDDTAVALVNCATLDARAVLASILEQFGYPLDFRTVNELANMVRVVVMQQASAGRPPLLVFENTHAMHPDALKAVCEISKLKLRRQSAARIVLSSNHSLEPVLNAPATQCLVERLTGEAVLWPMSEGETAEYLHAKLRAGGSLNPDWIFDDAVCEEMHRASGGWPGIVDRLALLALAKADTCPVAPAHIERVALPDCAWMGNESVRLRGSAVSRRRSTEAPSLVVTRDGRTLREVDFREPRILVGRSEHNDLCINSRFVSRHHALLIRQGAATFLMDLNSTNGTLVNSRRVSNHILAHDDVISIGNHRIKFLHPAAERADAPEGPGLDDTVVMQNLGDLRRILARENTRTLPLDASTFSTGNK